MVETVRAFTIMQNVIILATLSTSPDYPAGMTTRPTQQLGVCVHIPANPNCSCPGIDTLHIVSHVSADIPG